MKMATRIYNCDNIINFQYHSWLHCSQLTSSNWWLSEATTQPDRIDIRDGAGLACQPPERQISTGGVATEPTNTTRLAPSS